MCNRLCNKNNSIKTSSDNKLLKTLSEDIRFSIAA